MSPKYSLIIPTKTSGESLKKLLNSLKALDQIEHAEILIVQNPPRPERFDFKGLFKNLNIRYLTSNAGVNAARNHGMNECKGSLIFFIDDDCWISDSQFLIKHENVHAQNTWAFAVGGYYRNQSKRSVSVAYAEIQKEWLESNVLNKNFETQCLLGGHFSIKRKKDLPLFDDTIRFGGTETEYFFRLKKQGYRFLLIPDFIEHAPQMTVRSLIRKAHLQGRTHRRMVREGLIKDSGWISKKQNTYCKRLYQLSFADKGQAFKKSFRMPKIKRLKLPRGLRFRLSQIQQNVQFYLENRNLF